MSSYLGCAVLQQTQLCNESWNTLPIHDDIQQNLKKKKKKKMK